MSLVRVATASLCGIFLHATSVCAQPAPCDTYEPLKAYLETAHKMRETAQAWQVVPDPDRPDAALRFYRNEDSGVWAVMRLDPPNCARVIVTGYGWTERGEGRPL